MSLEYSGSPYEKKEAGEKNLRALYHMEIPEYREVSRKTQESIQRERAKIIAENIGKELKKKFAEKNISFDFEGFQKHLAGKIGDVISKPEIPELAKQKFLADIEKRIPYITDVNPEDIQKLRSQRNFAINTINALGSVGSLGMKSMQGQEEELESIIREKANKKDKERELTFGEVERGKQEYFLQMILEANISNYVDGASVGLEKGFVSEKGKIGQYEYNKEETQEMFKSLKELDEKFGLSISEELLRFAQNNNMVQSDLYKEFGVIIANKLGKEFKISDKNRIIEFIKNGNLTQRSKSPFSSFEKNGTQYDLVDVILSYKDIFSKFKGNEREIKESREITLDTGIASKAKNLLGIDALKKDFSYIEPSNMAEKIEKMSESDFKILLFQLSQLTPFIGNVAGGFDGLATSVTGMSLQGEKLSSLERSVNLVFGLLGITGFGFIAVNLLKAENRLKIANTIKKLGPAIEKRYKSTSLGNPKYKDESWRTTKGEISLNILKNAKLGDIKNQELILENGEKISGLSERQLAFYNRIKDIEINGKKVSELGADRIQKILESVHDMHMEHADVSIGQHSLSQIKDKIIIGKELPIELRKIALKEGFAGGGKFLENFSEAGMGEKVSHGLQNILQKALEGNLGGKDIVKLVENFDTFLKPLLEYNQKGEGFIKITPDLESGLKGLKEAFKKIGIEEKSLKYLDECITPEAKEFGDFSAKELTDKLYDTLKSISDDKIKISTLKGGEMIQETANISQLGRLEKIGIKIPNLPDGKLSETLLQSLETVSQFMKENKNISSLDELPDTLIQALKQIDFNEIHGLTTQGVKLLSTLDVGSFGEIYARLFALLPKEVSEGMNGKISTGTIAFFKDLGDLGKGLQGAKIRSKQVGKPHGSNMTEALPSKVPSKKLEDVIHLFQNRKNEQGIDIIVTQGIGEIESIMKDLKSTGHLNDFQIRDIRKSLHELGRGNYIWHKDGLVLYRDNQLYVLPHNYLQSAGITDYSTLGGSHTFQNLDFPKASYFVSPDPIRASEVFY